MSFNRQKYRRRHRVERREATRELREKHNDQHRAELHPGWIDLGSLLRQATVDEGWYMIDDASQKASREEMVRHLRLARHDQFMSARFDDLIASMPRTREEVVNRL